MTTNPKTTPAPAQDWDPTLDDWACFINSVGRPGNMSLCTKNTPQLMADIAAYNAAQLPTKAA